MDHFAGLDVSVKEASVCIVDDTGRIIRAFVTPSHSGRCLDWHRPSINRARSTEAVSKCGDEMMRVMLYEAAQSVLTRTNKWSWLKAWATKIARHRGMKKAIVALARRLAVIMHRIWVDGTEFRWTQEEAAAA